MHLPQDILVTGRRTTLKCKVVHQRHYRLARKVEIRRRELGQDRQPATGRPGDKCLEGQILMDCRTGWAAGLIRQYLVRGWTILPSCGRSSPEKPVIWRRRMKFNSQMVRETRSLFDSSWPSAAWFVEVGEFKAIGTTDPDSLVLPFNREADSGVVRHQNY